MALQYDALLAWPFEEIDQAYDEEDTILYALGIGLGDAPTDPRQLRFVYEDGLAALPTMAVVLGYPGPYLRDPATGVDWQQMVHGEQGLELHRPLAATGRVVSTNRVDAIVDKGPGRGALVYTTREHRDATTGEPIATLTATAFCRAEGGFGGPSGPVRAPHAVPECEPDQVVARPTLPQAALIYRLSSGDHNPLHADPAFAAAAGFERPVLHGLCTYGVAGYAILGALCAYDPGALRRLDCRFSAPVFPGDTITTLIWRESPGRAAFRCIVEERGAVVIDNGYVEHEA
ncbi:MAG: MaoC family dehydratase N-terminal domain-containing protein [Actinobacteria bacterium]|nr:MaoC family dehydratase N-terminal domain-containing protein [Actinomycetota bacterium]